jgi:hypothetical protein
MKRRFYFDVTAKMKVSMTENQLIKTIWDEAYAQGGEGVRFEQKIPLPHDERDRWWFEYEVPDSLINMLADRVPAHT